jgi:hypothetical protein
MCVFYPASSPVLNKIPQSEGDQRIVGARKGYPTTGFNMPTAINYLRRFDPSGNGNVGTPDSSDNIHITYDWTSRVLSAAAEALIALKGSVKVEFICAELFSELRSMRSGEDHHRPKEFPRSFLRVWMSNIP